MIKNLLHQKLFITLFLIWICFGGIILYQYNFVDIQIRLLNYHTNFLDTFFKYYTYLGDGVLIVIFGILLVMYRVRISIFIISTYLISGLFAQILKRFVFADMHRPAYVLKNMGITIPDIKGVVLSSYHSFPSGHTTSAFALFFSISLVFAKKYKWLQGVFFLLTLLVAISRVYLNMHFFNDVYCGSILGVLTTLIVYFSLYSFYAPWLDKSLVNILLKK